MNKMRNTGEAVGNGRRRRGRYHRVQSIYAGRAGGRDEDKCEMMLSDRESTEGVGDRHSHIVLQSSRINFAEL